MVDDTFTNAYSKTPIMLSGVGKGKMTRWNYDFFSDKLLSVFNSSCDITIVFNLDSKSDIENKLAYLHKLKQDGFCKDEDVAELEERLRTYTMNFGGRNPQPLTAVGLSSVEEQTNRKKGQKYIAYENGERVEKIARGKRKTVSDRTLEALKKAREKAHTNEANEKREKTVKVKRDNKTLGIN